MSSDIKLFEEKYMALRKDYQDIFLKKEENSCRSANRDCSIELLFNNFLESFKQKLLPVDNLSDFLFCEETGELRENLKGEEGTKHLNDILVSHFFHCQNALVNGLNDLVVKIEEEKKSHSKELEEAQKSFTELSLIYNRLIYYYALGNPKSKINEIGKEKFSKS